MDAAAAAGRQLCVKCGFVFSPSKFQSKAYKTCKACNKAAFDDQVGAV